MQPSLRTDARHQNATQLGPSAVARTHLAPSSPKRLALVTDTWHPTTNGLVNTLKRLVAHLESQNTEVLLITPQEHRTFQMPGDVDYPLPWDPWRCIPRLRAFKPDAVHISTEGPLGFWVNGYMRRRGLAFTSSFHTRFPEYLKARFLVPVSWGYDLERWFHRPAVHTLVGTRSMIRELEELRIGRRLVHWSRGVDTEKFHPKHQRKDVYEGLEGPIWLFVGRVAPEKSVEDFLQLTLPGTKVVVGDGPSREALARRYPDVVFRGWRFGDDLAKHFASADCFVFPSRTETFGNVILEALASGVPVAAVPAPGPVDLIQQGVNGAVDDDLRTACLKAIRCTREDARKSTAPYTYLASHTVFLDHLVPLRPLLPAPGTAPEALAAVYEAEVGAM
jgi:glycosyltransferase involved in cell wall biosynthesis